MRKLFWPLGALCVTLLLAGLNTGAKETVAAETLAFRQYLPVVTHVTAVDPYNNPPLPPGTEGFVATFDGDPAAPESWQPADWDVTVHSRDRDYWHSLESMQALHGAGCDAPPATHTVDSYENAVFRCRNHLMTAIRASGYGVIYLTPNQMVDFSAGEAVIRFDVSTFRTSKRDWIDLWITPYQDNLQAPLEDWLPDLNGEPRQAVHIRMDFGSGTPPGGSFEGFVIRNFEAEEMPQQESAGYESFLTPSPTERQTFELRISATHIKFGLPAHNFWWIDTPVADLGWEQGVVQFGHHSYNPMKGCTTCSPNTWHWDNIQINPAVPFTLVRSDRRFVDATNSTVQLNAPAPAAAHLRFSGIGESLEVSFDNGVNWQTAEMQAQEEFHEDHFRTYWTPIPAGITSVQFRGQTWYGGGWHARDISVWSLQPPTNGIEGKGSGETLSWVGFVPAAPEACLLPAEEQAVVAAN